MFARPAVALLVTSLGLLPLLAHTESAVTPRAIVARHVASLGGEARPLGPHRCPKQQQQQLEVERAAAGDHLMDWAYPGFVSWVPLQDGATLLAPLRSEAS
ncbi:hypothetical protein FGE12_25800 [Aggregicoccus sp. 17bor-14]|uniref:hypothetical protein n=1 Tax=Myxococcaceae TaxID=31 RepID=UPI00129C8FD2|nr:MULTISPECIES: hypothetical protein [Myxococcaceae]MBF5045850.1 hypothetical protein [Simulacricoccus sp. 17bor-14]MRI91584.1 hypothetical protein [Aggregicoccus sp. 17bor-14]